MARRAVQALSSAFLLLATCWLAPGAAAADEGPFAQQLRAECHALLEHAIRRPYGMAWTDDLQFDPRDRKPLARMSPPGSAAAGMVLLWAGELLREPQFVEAGVMVARGVAAVQAPNGNVPPHPQFGPAPGAREPFGAVPDRAATRAGLVLMLGAIGADHERDELLRRSARRAAAWLVKQQTPDGSFATTAPADNEYIPHRRVLRLDTPESRDSLFALLLAGHVLDDKPALRAAQRSAEKLVSLRLGMPQRLSGLWCAVYRLDGTPADDVAAAVAGADVLASRRAIEALIAHAILSEDPQAAPVAQDAATTIKALREADGRWFRIHPFGDVALPPPATEPILGPPPTTEHEPAQSSGIFGLNATLPAVDWLQQNGAPQLRERLAETQTLEERLAAAILGLDDLPLDLSRPSDAAQIDAWMADQADWAGALDGAPPATLDARVRRLYVLLIRARAESDAAASGR